MITILSATVIAAFATSAFAAGDMMQGVVATDRRCCTSPRFKDSLGESSGLDGWDEQAASPRLPYHELAHVQPRA